MVSPAPATSARSYITRAFGDRLAEARSAMEARAVPVLLGELNQVEFWLYRRFRPDVPEGAQGWGAKGAKGEILLDRIGSAAA
jgi:hypothetical protein